MEASKGQGQPICLGKYYLSRGLQGMGSWVGEGQVSSGQSKGLLSGGEKRKLEAWSWTLGSLDSA